MRSKLEKNKSVLSWILFAFLALYSIILLFLYFWGFGTSLKTVDDFMKHKVNFIPSGSPLDWQWSNYSKALELFSIKRVTNGKIVIYNFSNMFFNSLTYSFMGPLITLSTTWIMAYLTANYDRKASRFIYRMNFIIMAIPIVGNLPSSLQVYMKLGLYNTWGYVIVSSIAFIGGNYLIFFAVLKSVSKEICEAAQIDGAGQFSIMLRIVFPMTINMFAILYLMGFIANWNSYMTMLIYMPDIPNLAYGIYNFSVNKSLGASYPNMQMAGCYIVVIPMFTLFMIFKNKIIGSVTIGSFK